MPSSAVRPESTSDCPKGAVTVVAGRVGTVEVLVMFTWRVGEAAGNVRGSTGAGPVGMIPRSCRRSGAIKVAHSRIAAMVGSRKGPPLRGGKGT